MAKSDPLSASHYSPLQTAEKLSGALFWAAAVSSIVALQLNRDKQPYYDIVQSSFVVSVVLFFVMDLAVRLYWAPRAHAKRNADFVSNAFGVCLTDEASVGYYNNKATDPIKRIVFSILENSLFSKTIVRKMLLKERLIVGGYAIVWFLAVLNRATDLALVTTVAQVLFSEQIISRWIRMEWLRAKFERVFDDTYSLVQTASDSLSKEFQARCIECLLRYESSKAQAGISLSSKIFEKNNRELSRQWDAIYKKLNQ